MTSTTLSAENLSTPGYPPPAAPAPGVVRARRRRRFGWRPVMRLLCAVVLLWMLLLAASIYHVLWLGSDVRALRNAIAAPDRGLQKRIELRVGALPVSLMKAGLSFFDLDAEARLGLAAVRSVEGGVYRWNPGAKPRDTGEFLRATDAAMNKRGWDRMVTVMKGRNQVVLYGRPAERSITDVPVCLLVQQKEDLVLVSGRADLEPLWELVRREIDWEDLR